MTRRYFVTGIGADVGKTLLSAILAEALAADYWKPIQAGNTGFTDSDVVRSLVSNAATRVHPEAFKLNETHIPLTPSNAGIGAAALSAKALSAITPPATSNHLIVEGAGGVLLPLSRGFTNRDLMLQLGMPVIVVSRNYLGSMNHTLLSIEALTSKAIPIAGIVFNGEPHVESESFILEHTGLKLLGNIGIEEMIDQATVKRYAAVFARSLSVL